MIRKAMSHRLVFHRIVGLLAAVCMAVSACTGLSADSAETGIRGTVTWGPVVPGPSRLGQSDEAPLKAMFIVFRAGQKITTFESDDEGRFEVALPAGEYVIVPDKSTPIPYPLRQTTQVAVPADGFAEVTIRLDTGMK